MKTLRRPVVLLVSLFVAPVALAASFGGVDVPPPPAPRPLTETIWGVAVPDPYRFLEDTKDPQVQSWMKAQNDATEAIFARIPGRETMLARIREIESKASGVTQSAERAAGGRYVFLKRDPQDNQFKLVWRETADGPDRLIVDPEALAKATGKPHAVMDFAASPDGRRVAYSMQAGGSEIGTLHVVDLQSGKPLIEPIDRIRYASAAWLDDGSGFFYSRLREGYEKYPVAERFDDHARHFRSLADAQGDRNVFSPLRDAGLGLPRYASGDPYQIAGTKLAANRVYFGVDPYQALYLGDLDAATKGTATWTKVVGVDDKAVEIGIAGGYVYLRTSKRAPRFEIVRMPLSSPDPARAEVVVPASESVIVSMRAARDALYVVRRDGATHSLWRLKHGADAKPERIALPFEGAIELTGASDRLDGVVFDLGGWTRATKPWFYDPSVGRVAQLPFVAPGAYDAPDDIMAREIRYRSHDGVEVPMSIVMRKDAKLDGSHPTILYGYGAYGLTEDPFLNPRWYAWVQRGGVLAFAHVRGGGAFGEEWHLAGRKATKPNTWKDAIAAAEWLVAKGYTSKSRIGIYGGSAGGIFVGRAITERPDLFAAAVPAVGIFDAPRFELASNGAANVPEFGSVRNEQEFKALMAMSTYHEIRDGTAYPGILLAHGVNDIRVPVSESLKAGARFAAATSSGRPVLQRLEFDSGHGQGSTRAQSQLRTTDVWTFMLWQFGVPEYQPTRAEPVKKP
jgi:prolyl oligopeptidase